MSAAANTRSAADPPIPHALSRLLVIGPSWVGDMVMATGVLRAIRRERPSARISLAVRPNLLDLLAGFPHIDHVVALDMKRGLGPFRAAQRSRREDAEAVLLMPNSFRSALTARLARIPRRIGYVRDGRGFLLTHGFAVERAELPGSTRAYYERLGAFALGVERLDEAPELAVTSAEQAAADELLRDVARPFVALCPGANRADKRWPAERFAAVADALAARRGLAAIVCGAPEERLVAAAVVSSARSAVVDLVARGLNLGALKAVLARARLLVTNDTGPRHIASALGTPVVSLFGPTDHRWTTPTSPTSPSSPNSPVIAAGRTGAEHVLVADPFLPETLVADRNAKRCAIDRITVGDALSAAERLLATPHPPPGTGGGLSPQCRERLAR